MIDFPASPTVGQTFNVSGATWTWDGSKWISAGTGSGFYVPLAGGVMTGDLVLNRDPVVALGAATKQYADSERLGDNRIINGDMRIDQRNNGASGTGISAYPVDRWFYTSNMASKGTWQRVTTTLAGFPYSFSFTSSSAYTPAAGDYFQFRQAVEADMISDLAFGTLSAQPVTVSFWVYASVAGTYSGSLRDYAATRSYCFSFTVLAATWTRIVITIPGDTGGSSWVLSGNGGGLFLTFDLGGSTTYRGPANAWVSGNYIGVTGAVSVVATNAATFYLTGVKLETGNIATPYNRQSLAKSLIDCQRYYQVFPSMLIIAPYAAAGITVFPSFTLPVTMRANPTGALANITNVANCTSQAFTSAAGGASFYCSMIATAAGQAYYQANVLLNAEL